MHGWLDGANLNASRLDLFYWLLAVFGLVSSFLYLLCAWRYTHRHDPRMRAAIDDDKVAPESTKQDTV
jgi:type IV secretory pathway TrbD component